MFCLKNWEQFRSNSSQKKVEDEMMVNKRNLWLVSSVFLIASLSLLTGCATHKQRPPVMGMETPEKLDAGDVAVEVMPARNRDLNARVVKKNDSASDEVVAEYIQTKVQSELAEMGFKMSIENPDFLVELKTETSMYDSFGEFMIYDASVKTEVLGPPSLNRIASNSHNARSERKLGKGAALGDVAHKLAGQITSWLKNVLTPARLRTASSRVIVTLPENLSMKPSEYAAALVTELSGFPGVNACQVVSTSYETIVLELDHNTDSFPEGLSNRIQNIQGPEVAVMERTVLTVSLPEEYPSSLADYAILFVESVASLNGVDSCKVIESNQLNRTLQFMVIYNPELFPTGLYNQIVSIEQLGLLSR